MDDKKWQQIANQSLAFVIASHHLVVSKKWKNSDFSRRDNEIIKKKMYIYILSRFISNIYFF